MCIWHEIAGDNAHCLFDLYSLYYSYPIRSLKFLQQKDFSAAFLLVAKCLKGVAPHNETKQAFCKRLKGAVIAKEKGRVTCLRNAICNYTK